MSEIGNGGGNGNSGRGSETSSAAPKAESGSSTEKTSAARGSDSNVKESNVPAWMQGGRKVETGREVEKAAPRGDTQSKQNPEKPNEIKCERNGESVAYRPDKDTLDAIPHSKPLEAGFKEGKFVTVADAQGRAVSSEAWAIPEKGKPLDQATRDRICGVYRDGLNASHLYPRGAGGPPEANLASARDTTNNAMSSFERDICQRVGRGELLYLRGLAHYDSPAHKQASALELQVWKRGDDGSPVWVDGRRVDSKGVHLFN